MTNGRVEVITSVERRRPPAHQFLLRVIRCSIGEWYRTSFCALVHRILHRGQAGDSALSRGALEDAHPFASCLIFASGVTSDCLETAQVSLGAWLQTNSPGKP
jgi:hypothetical protein